MEPNSNNTGQVPQAPPVIAQAQQQSSQPPPQDPNSSSDPNMVIAILLLVLIYPIGLIFMWFGTKWPKWVKLLITAPMILAIVGIVSAIYLVSLNPAAKIKDARSRALRYVTPTPIDETANWQTYTNTEYGFNFKYPDNLFLFDCSLGTLPKGVYVRLVEDKNQDCNTPATGSQNIITFNTNDNFNEVLNVGKLMERDEESVVIDGQDSDFIVGDYEQVGGEGGKIASHPIIHVGYALIPLGNTNLVATYRRVSQVANNDSFYKVQKDMTNTFKQMLSTLKITSMENQSYLEIPEYGVKIPLTENIKDAYRLPETASKGYVYLKVHSLDSEPQCLKDPSSTAAIARLGKNDPIPYGMTYEEFTSSRVTGATIGDYFYYIDLAQYPCAESKGGQALLEKVRKEFSDASKNITSL